MKVGGSSSYGDSDVIRIKTSSSVYQGYLKFTVTGLNGIVVAATLRLYVTDQGDGDGVSVFPVGNNYTGTATLWDESGLNSDNAPVIGTTPLNSLSSISDNGWAEFDVTSAIAGNGSYSFALTTQSSDGKRFSSKEGSQTPELVIETGTPLAKQMTQESQNTEGLVSSGSFRLYQNYPNPFNPKTSIHYELREAGEVSIKVFDLGGREIRTLISVYQAIGIHTVVWDEPPQTEEECPLACICVE